MANTKTKSKLKQTSNKGESETINVPTAFQDRIIIMKKKPEERTASGLFIPSIAITEENKGIVVNVGPLVGRTVSSAVMLTGETNDAIPKIGDMVLFGEYAGMTVNFEGNNFLVVKEADVLCKI